MVKALDDSRGADSGMKSESLGDYSYTTADLPDILPPSVMAEMKRYQRPIV